MTPRQLRIVHDAGPETGRGTDTRVPDPVRSLLGSARFEALLQRGLQAIMALSGARGGAVRLVSADGRHLELASAAGLSPAMLLEERVVALDCGICGAALESDGAQLDSRLRACPLRVGCAQGEDCGPVLAVPLHCGGKSIGVFNLFFGGSARVPADLAALAEPTARLLDLIFENALLEHERLNASLAAERHLLAGEVHDSLAQGLAYMRMRMPLLDDSIRAGDRPQALKYFQDVSGAMGEAHARLRELITHFRHSVDEGLIAALEGTARTFAERTGVELTIDNRAAGLRLAPDEEAQVYHIVREALANVVKHARASKARIVLQNDARGVSISVEDDGTGVARRAGPTAAGHYGLDIMRERAERIGARVEIRSTPGHGTRVRVVLPARVLAGD